jgi:nucleoside-diphosphate-sugar epimerase
MRVFVAGATGVLGRELVRQLLARGHQVVGLARSEANEALLRRMGAAARRADLFDAGQLARAAEACEAIVHAATSIPTKPRTTPADWAVNDRIRREGTQALGQAAVIVGARVYVQQSVAWLAAPPDGRPFDEDSPAHPDPPLQSALDGEQIAQEAGARGGFRVAVVRCGWFYGAETAHTRMFGELLRRRRLPVIGAGDAVWCVLHTADAAGAFVAALEKPASGVWHVVDDQPVTGARDARGVCAAARCASAAARPGVACASVGGRSGGAILSAQRAHHQRALPARLRLGPALPHLPRRARGGGRGMARRGFPPEVTVQPLPAARGCGT